MIVQNFHWSAMPFLRMLVPLILGILSYDWIDFRSNWVPLLMIPFWILYGYLINSRLHYKRQYIYGLLIQSLVVLFGYNLAAFQDEIKDPNHFQNYITETPNKVFGVIIDLKERKNRYEVVTCVHFLGSGDALFQVTGKLNTYVPYTSIDTTLRIGQQIHFSGIIVRHQPVRNPFVFNYGAFLERKQKFHQTAKVNKLEILGKAKGLMIWFENHRQKILKSLKKDMNNPKHYSIAASILLGYRNDVDAQTKKAFAQTGSMHILAVSGMHVGVIWLIAGWFINLIRSQTFSYRLLKCLLALATIWGFVFLAGAPPSALRAAWLFSIISFTNILQRDSNIFHRLCIAAFAMLCYNTNLIFDVGFQLSFTAVMGIVGFLSIWERFVFVENRLVMYLYNGLGMTIGATLGTLPLTMYYFHYFPITGLISGVVVVVLATFILIVGVSYLCIYWLSVIWPIADFLSVYIANLLNHIVAILMTLIEWFHSIPLGLIENISISGVSVLIIYCFLLGLLSLITKLSKLAGYVSAISFCLFTGLAFLKTYNTSFNRQLAIYHDYKSNGIELFIGSLSVLIADTHEENSNAAFINEPLKRYNGIKSTTQISYNDSLVHPEFSFKNMALKFLDLELLIVDQQGIPKNIKNLDWDYVLFIDNPDISISKLKMQINFTEIIFGASNTDQRIEQWKLSCKRNNIPFTDIKNTKAKIINL